MEFLTDFITNDIFSLGFIDFTFSGSINIARIVLSLKDRIFEITFISDKKPGPVSVFD